MDKASFDQIVEAFEETGEVRSYSGRGMFGDHCLGVDCDNASSAILSAISGFAHNAETGREVEDFIELLSGHRVDSMGQGQILYFPSIEWQEEESEDEDDGDDGDDEHYLESSGHRHEGREDFHSDG
jgi:hypothetical protein